MTATVNRLLVSLLVLCCVAATSRAQGTLQTLSLTGGYSLPVGKFASENFNDPEAGLAGSGYFGQLTYERRFWPRLGFRASGSLNINNTNPDPVIEQYSALLPNKDTYSWQTDAATWQLGSVMLGPIGYIDFARWQLEGHVVGGMIFAKSPSLTVAGTSSTGTNPVDARVSSGQTSAFGFGAGGSLRVPLARRLYFQLSADWIAARAELKDVPTYAKIGAFPAIEMLRTEKRFVGVVNVGAGLAVAF
ncbi:hypothetical protein GCM10027275_33020 [Rhabdobacter roseus]|uniref:Outer membrane protein beta-barrel domain-containing protein n=1 Tax=Rhabdobacter roseus TaxID=1655419 RepID=A0A840TMJ1_9BACT|nr:hypothetical protein [Rhabdobacter roseus]MBB5285476.1 hypothetical protein [Rhabdobacter roseus]